MWGWLHILEFFGRHSLNSEVQNTCSTLEFHVDMAEPVLLYFFALIRAFAFYIRKALALRIFKSNILPHFAKFAGIQVKII